MVFSLIVFDLDGTLVDSRKDIADSANLLLQSCGAAPLPDNEIALMVGDGVDTLVARAFAASGAAAPADAIDRYLEIYGRRLLNHTRAYPGIPEVLAALAERASLGVLTNKPLAATRQILSGLGFSPYFRDDRVVGGDGPLPRKPRPEGLRHLVAGAGVDASRTVLVGDSLNDWRTARNAGTRVCLARYGFGFHTFPTDQLSPDDFVIDAPFDLLKLSTFATR